MLPVRQSIARHGALRAPVMTRSFITRASLPILKSTLKSTLEQQQQRSCAAALFPVSRALLSSQSVRSYSVLSNSPKAKLYKYEDIKEVASHPEKHPETLLIDVREPVEFNDGHIPHAHNVPFKSSPGALDLSPEDFEESFGFEKPAQDKELVFYCLGGVRSTAAEELANTFGYEKRGNYVGSWEDWVARENAKKESSTVGGEQQQAKL